MNSLLNSVFLTAVWVVPILILVSFLVVSLFTRNWQSQSRKWLANSRSILRKMEMDGERVRQSIQDLYALEDAEPFSSKMTNVNETLFLLDQQITAFREEYLAIHLSMKDIRVRRLGDFLRIPFKWQRVYEQVQHLQWNEHHYLQLLHCAEENLHSLQRVGIEVAAQAQDMHTSYLVIKPLYEHFSTSAMGEKYFMEVKEKMDLLQLSIESIPLVFLTGSEDEILSLTDEAMVIHTHNILQQINPMLKQITAKLSTWNTQYQNAAHEFQQLQLVTGRLEKVIASMPEDLRTDNTSETYNKLVAFVDHTRDTFNHPTPQDLTSIAREARQMKRIAEDLEKEYTLVIQQFQESHEAVMKLVEVSSQLHNRYRTLEKNPFTSLTWDETRSHLDMHRQQVDQMVQVAPGSFSSVKERMKTITAMKASLEELEQHYYQVEAQFIQYLALLDKLVPKGFGEWAGESRQFSAMVKEYSQSNWVNEQELDFLDEVKVLKDDLMDWYPRDLTAPIQESLLPQQLAHGLRIDALHQVLNDQMTGIRKRLEQIRQVEANALEDLRHARGELDSIASLVRENQTLSFCEPAKIAGFQRELDNLSARFENRQRGSVDEKTAKTKQLLAQINKYLSAQIDRLRKMLDEQRAEMKKIAEHLDSIAHIDKPVIVETRQQAKRIEGKVERRLDLSTHSLETLRATLLTLVQQYLHQAGVLDDLQDMKNSLDLAFKAFTGEQHTARQFIDSNGIYQELSANMSSAHELVRVRQEFNRLEKEWSLTRQQPLALDTLITRLNDFQERYRTFNKNLGNINTRLESERDRIQHIFADLDALTGRWEKQQQAYRGDARVQRQIQNLLNNVKRRRQTLERQYKGGRVNVELYVNSLNDLLLSVKETLIPLDDQQRIDINGEVIE